MTGLFGRFRAWLGSLFGGEAEESTDAEDDGPRLSGGGPGVTHRDDRPLETPDIPPGAAEDPPVSGADAAGDDAADGETPDEATEADDAVPTDGSVSIPDAEALAGGDDPTESADPESPPVEPHPDAVDAADADAGDGPFTCAVCGTAVDDVAGGCPLCGSTDVVPEDA
jgi:hypothetical protein